MQILQALLKVSSLALLGATALTVSSVAAQDVQSFEPPCKEALRLSPDAFTDLFVKKTNDGSEAGLDQAAIYWTNCKYNANLARLNALPTLRARLNNLDQYTGQFIGAETELASSADGGGTMFPHSRARFQPILQLHFEQLIALTTRKAGAVQSAAISARYAVAKRKLEARLKRVQTPQPFTDGDTKADADAKRRQWLESASKYSKAYQNIRKTIGSRIDATSVLVIEFLARGLWAEEL